MQTTKCPGCDVARRIDYTPNCGLRSGGHPNTGPDANTVPTVIKLADAGWETLSINNAIAKWIIENGYGYDVDIVASSDWRKDLTDGTVDIIMEGWEQNYREWYKRVTDDGSVKPLGTIFENGPQFFVIPQWVADEYEIRTIYDMEKHWELFEDPSDSGRGIFIHCPTGNQCAEVNPVKLESYKL